MKKTTKATLLITLFMTTHVAIPMEHQPMCLTDAATKECSGAFNTPTMLSVFSVLYNTFILSNEDPRLALTGLAAGAAFVMRCSDPAMDPLCMNSIAKQFSALMAFLAVSISLVKYPNLIWEKAVRQWRNDPTSNARKYGKSLDYRYRTRVSLNAEDKKQIREFEEPKGLQNLLVYALGVGLIGAIISV